MEDNNIIIIGAGAAGLMAAYTLVKAGKKVTVLEALSRTGGRIHTVTGNFEAPVELGAEFVHGNLPVTLSLFKEAGIEACSANAEMWQYQNGRFTQNHEFIDGIDILIDTLNNLKEDMPVYNFMQQNFAGSEFTRMRSQITSFIAGYDTASVHDASTFSLRNELSNEGEDNQYRPEGGYQRLINYLKSACHNAGSTILCNTVVKQIQWQDGHAEIITDTNIVYKANKVIIAVPLGVLKAHVPSEGAIQFIPPLPQHTEAFNNIGFGAVIKILLQFDEILWESDAIIKTAGASLRNMGYLFTQQEIPTYWTQAPAHKPLLTGWLGGPAAYAKKDTPDDIILDEALQSLSKIFTIDVAALKNKLTAWQVVNWTAKPFTRGSYAYDMVNSPRARKILQQPVQDTLYFAGEYLYEGPAMGTVEAALTSGKEAAAIILKTV